MAEGLWHLHQEGHQLPTSDALTSSDQLGEKRRANGTTGAVASSGKSVSPPLRNGCEPQIWGWCNMPL